MGETMQAGRELDALVAERWFGLHIIKPVYGSGEQWFAVRYPERRQGPGDKHIWSHDGHPFGFFKMWSPSTDIAAAWEVVERPLPDGHFWRIVQGRLDWTASICEEHIPATAVRVLHRGLAKTPSHAICLAALAAARSSAPTPQEGTPHG